MDQRPNQRADLGLPSDSERPLPDQNIDQLFDRLEAEDRWPKREPLRRQLIAEEDRYGSLVEQLDAADRLIDKVQRRISDTVARAQSGMLFTMAQRLVINQCDILAVIKARRQVIADRLKRADLG